VLCMEADMTETELDDLLTWRHRSSHPPVGRRPRQYTADRPGKTWSLPEGYLLELVLGYKFEALVRKA
jgi:hypothetical protein